MIKTLFAFVILSITFLSCNPMKKNLMEDIADDVKEVLISGSGGKAYLIIKEEIFQATSKSDNGGIRQITGYDEYRISSYNLNTGRLSKRIPLGDREENECTFLGQTEGKLWYKSVDINLRFHARDPENLDVIVTQEMITDKNSFLKDNLSQPEWNSVNSYYGFDIDNNMPMVTDNSGFVYLIEPVSFKAEKTTESIKNFDYDHNCLSGSMKLDVNKSIYLKGSPRNYIDVFNKEIKDISFLKGEFIVSSNILSPTQEAPEFFAPYKLEITKYKKDIDSIEKLIQSFDTNPDESPNGKFKENNRNYAQRNIGYLRDKIKYAEDNIKRYSRNDNYDIITKDNGVFILSQTDVTDKAKIIISKVKINSDSTLTLSWQTELQNIYRNPDKGMDRSSFEVVFSKGDPNLSTMRAVSGEGKLVFLSMLNAVCLDAESGKILWSRELK